jgi:glucuronoarabinoxylan endo-1,4-beta-xylanase
MIAPERARAVTVTVDGLVRNQTMDGFGSSERAFDDPHVFENFNPATGRSLTLLTAPQQDEVLDRLYRDLRLTRVRSVSPDTAPGAGIEPVNDNGDPAVLDPTKFDFSWKRLDAHCEYFGRARQRGASTFFLSPVNREAWMGTTTLADAAEYAEWLFAQVGRCASLGVALPYLSVANEPSHVANPMSGAFIRDVIKVLGPRLRAQGFQTLFVVPDDIRSSAAAAVAETILADPAARPYVGALATHLYDEPLSRVAAVEAVADRYGLPLWMTEFTQFALPTAGVAADPFNWAEVMHTLIATHDVSAIDYLWGYLGDWAPSTQTLITLNDDGGRYVGHTVNKAYYTTGQFSRFVPPGAVRLGVAPTDLPANVTAFLYGGNVIVVAVNASASNQPLEVVLTSLPGFDRVLPVRTSETENWVQLPPIAVDGSSFGATLPARSVTTFVSNPRALPPPGPAPPATSLLGTAPQTMLGGDQVPPRLSALRLSPKRFGAGPRLPRAVRARSGSVISFRLSEPATVSLRFERARQGRRRGRRCVSPDRGTVPRRRCTRYARVRGAIRIDGRAGANRLRFGGRITRKRSLRPGSYRLTAVAVDRAGHRSAARRARFALLPHKR